MEDHFTEASKIVDIGSGTECGTEDWNLARLARYLVALETSGRKKEMAAVKSYFAVQSGWSDPHDTGQAQLLPANLMPRARPRVAAGGRPDANAPASG